MIYDENPTQHFTPINRIVFCFRKIRTSPSTRQQTDRILAKDKSKEEHRRKQQNCME